MAELGIGDVSRRTGIASSALRYYEAEGLIPKAPRRSGRRVYDESILDRLALIELAKTAGFTVAEIQQLLKGITRPKPPGERWRSMASGKLREVEGRLEELLRMKQVLESLIGCDCPSLEVCSSSFRR